MLDYFSRRSKINFDTATKALVINSKRNGLAVIRSLGAKGIQIIAVDHFNDAIGLYSRYVTVREIAPLVTTDEKHFVSAIIEIAKRHGQGKKLILFPTSDTHLMAFVRYWHDLDPYFYPTFELNPDILHRCLDKTKVEELARTSNVPIPKTVVSPTKDNRLHGLNFPLIVKPNIRSSPEAVSAKIFRLKLCNNEADVEQAACELEKKGFSFIVQEYIPGGDDALFTVGLYAVNGEIRAIFTCRKLRQFPPDFGECSYGEIVKEPLLNEYAHNLISEAQYTGIAQIEFKKFNNIYYLIEINPRAWSWISLSKIAGVDIPWITYINTLSGEKVRCSQKRWSGKWSYLGGDMDAESKREKPIGKLRIIMQSVFANTHSIWSISDPMPGIIQLIRDIK